MAEPDEHVPDPAALDELQRAFGRSGDADIADGAPATPPPIEFDVPDIADHTDPTGEPAEIVIVEQEPPDAAEEPAAEPPKIIRIDDYGGSTEIIRPPEPTAEASPTNTPAASTSAADEPDDEVEPIVIAAEDDLPDTVYVEGSLDPSGGRTIVFIDDDDTGDAVAPGAEREGRRGIEPKLRARRAAIRRAMGRKRLRWFVLGTLVLLVGVAVLALLGSGLFAIKEDQVTVYNAVYADEEALNAVIDDLVGTPALLVDVQQAEADLEAIPWVDEARVRVSFPNAATIELSEREAMATYQAPDGQFRVIDREGRVLDVRPGYPFAYVLLMGPDPVDLEPGQFAPQGYAAAAELAKNLTSSIRGEVVWIDVTADGSQLKLLLDDGTEVRFGAARDLFNKLLRLETVLANNPELEPGVIDVSTSEVTF